MTTSMPDMNMSTTFANDSLPHLPIPNFLIGNKDRSEFFKLLNEILTLFERMKIISPVVSGVLIVLGLIGNLLVILAISIYKHMRTKTNIFLLSLAVADLLYITTTLPFDAIDAISDHGWSVGLIMCAIRYYMQYVTFFVSAYALLGVSFNRFLAVVFPIKSIAFRTRINAIRTVLLLWLIILLANIPILFMAELTSRDGFDGKKRTHCFISKTAEENKRFSILLFVFGYSMPLALIFILYGLIATQLLRRAVPENSNSQVKKRAIRMCAVVVAVFTLSRLPSQAYVIWSIYNPQKIKLEDFIPFFLFNYVSDLLPYINSCANPVLYAFLSDAFRTSFKKLTLCDGVTRQCVACPRRSVA